MEQEGGLYQAERTLMISMLEALVAQGGKMRPELLEGEWELVRCLCVWGGGSERVCV